MSLIKMMVFTVGSNPIPLAALGDRLLSAGYEQTLLLVERGFIIDTVIIYLSV
jgi:hypothetical protein